MKANSLLLFVAAGLALALGALFHFDGGREAGAVRPSVRQQAGPGSETAAFQRKTIRTPWDRVLESALNLGDAAEREAALAGWAAEVDLRQMRAKLEELERIGDAALQKEASCALLASWLERDYQGMIGWVCDLRVPNEKRELGRGVLIEAFAEREPSQMFAWMEQSLTEMAKVDLYPAFFREWTRQDPGAAGEKLRMLTEGAAGRSALWENMIPLVAAEWSLQNRREALSWLGSLPESGTKKLAMARVMALWTEQNPAEAAAFSTGQGDHFLVRKVAERWAENNPEEAAAWAKALPAGEARSAALVEVTAIWARTEPEKMARWSEQFPEGPAREQMLGQLVSAWTALDAPAAAAWLEKLPPSASRDFAVSAYCTVADRSHPENSFRWAAAIRDETLRFERMRLAAEAWMKRDAGNAARSIRNSLLPENVKSQLLRSGQS